MPARAPQRQQLMEVLAPVVQAQGYDLEDLSVSAAGRRSVIRVIVDGDGGIDLDAVADVARAISETLDEAEAAGTGFAGAYVLEVSSPGVDRPLTEVRHWRRAIGRLVSVTITEQSTAHELTGRVVAVDDAAVEFDLGSRTQAHPFTALGPGRVQVEFSRPGQPELDDPDVDDPDVDDPDLDTPGLDDEADPARQEEEA